jgi:uncharacterized protein YodC (DUF2158 family)
MLDRIEIGDTVKLKSGGPFMTVSSISGDFVSCEWFDMHNQAQTKSFRLITLDKDPAILGKEGETARPRAKAFSPSSLRSSL